MKYTIEIYKRSGQAEAQIAAYNLSGVIWVQGTSPEGSKIWASLVCLMLAGCSGMPALPQEYVELCAKEAKVTYFMDNLPLPAKKIALISDLGSYCRNSCINLLLDGYTHVQVEVKNPRPYTFTDKPGIYQYSFRKIGDPLCRGFEEYISKYLDVKIRSQRMGLVDRCIAIEKITEIDADVQSIFKYENIVIREDYTIGRGQSAMLYNLENKKHTVVQSNSYNINFKKINKDSGVGYNAACVSEGYDFRRIFRPVGHDFSFDPPNYRRQ